MSNKDHAYWIADKIPACGEYAAEASLLLRKQADEIERLTAQVAMQAEALEAVYEDSNLPCDHITTLVKNATNATAETVAAWKAENDAKVLEALLGSYDHHGILYSFDIDNEIAALRATKEEEWS